MRFKFQPAMEVRHTEDFYGGMFELFMNQDGVIGEITDLRKAHAGRRLYEDLRERQH